MSMTAHTKRRRVKAEKQRIAALKHVADKDAAWALFRTNLGEVDYDDNYRSAFVDNAEEYAEYERIQLNGCCGSYDFSVMIDGREFVMGCNFGH